VCIVGDMKSQWIITVIASILILGVFTPVNSFAGGGGPCETAAECDAGDACNAPEICESSTCVPGPFAPPGTTCGSAGTECSGQDTCDGAGSCDVNDLTAGAACGDTGVVCLIDDTCNGAGSCSDGGAEPDLTDCGFELECSSGECVPEGPAVGGAFVPIDNSALILAGAQSVSMWMIPVVIAGIGVAIFVIKRRN